jgi:hypothetical protein
VAKTTRRRAQLHGQQLPAKKGKVRARLVQTAQIQDWDNLTPDQQQEALNWGIDIDVDESSDSDENMSGQAGGSSTFTMAATGGGSTGGGGPPGGGPPAGGGGGGGGPPGPAGPAAPVGPPPTLDDLTRLMADVGNAVGILAQQVLDLTRAQNAGRSGTKDAIPRPKAWDGKGGSAEARHFLAAFHNFASAQGTSLNVLDATTGMWTSVPGRWIQAALNLMEADARTWALPYLEEIQAGNMPFGGVWQTFLDHFTRRFAPLNTEDSARDALKCTRQNKGTVAEYMAMFDQYAGQTGWSPVDLRQRFYDGLNDRVKDALAGTHQPIGTIDELRAAAQSLDQRWWQREAEKKGHTFTLGNPKPSDPNAMQVDATRQDNSGNKTQKNRGSYIKHMQGKCYGCGSDKHTKKDGNHERDVCNHCGKTGHRSPVCFTKYIGKPATAKTAATTDGSTSQATPPSAPKATASASTSAPAKNNKTQADLLAELMKRIEDQDAQIKALKVSF